MTDISLPAAAGAGFISFLSPCVLPLAPPYLCYLAGATIEELADEGKPSARRDMLIASLLFVLGFSTVFVAMGATASVFGALLRQWSHVLAIVAGFGIIAMGAHFLGLFQISAMLREKRVEVAKPAGLWAAYLMGLAFAFGWTPCIGPILAAILAVAGRSRQSRAARCCSPPTPSASAPPSSSRRSRWSGFSGSRAAFADISPGWRRRSARSWR